MMDKNIPHADDIRPGNSCIICLKFIGETTARFANNCDVMNNLSLNQFI
jgi:hypothetical protein